jgi:CheY-like chemotaxis protein
MARILVIEDNEPLSAILRHTLEAAGHTVVHAQTGRAGISILRVALLDVVLTDLVMPDQDGIGVIMMIRQEMPEIPVIAMSGGLAHSALYLDLAKKLGARRVLVKPFTSEELFEALAAALGTS